MKYLTEGSRKNKWIISISYLLYFACCMILFYSQSIARRGIYGSYGSDLLLHIDFGLTGENNYSICYLLYKILYQISGNTVLIALFLSLVTVFTVKVTCFALDYFFRTQNLYISPVCLNLLAFISTFTMSIRIPYVYPHSYFGTLSGPAWHNSTYLVMRLVGIAFLILYFEIEKTYLTKGIKIGPAIVFAAVLILINSIKPNFFLFFAPYMALKLLIDLIKFQGDFKIKFKRIILFGCCVLPSAAILLVQYQVLFGKGTGAGITLGAGYTMKVLGGTPVMMVILGLAFPIVVLIKNYKELISDKIYRSIWGMWLVAFSEYFFLIESGSRKNDANFAWGMMFATCMLFVVSIYKLVCNFITIKKQRVYGWQTKVYIVLANGVLFFHFVSGLWFFVRLVLGGTYQI